MGKKIPLHGGQAATLKRIWLDQARKFSDRSKDLRDFIQSAHTWSDMWHTTVWRMPDADQQRGLLHRPTARRMAASGRRTRADRQRYSKKMTARFPGTAGHRQR
jgi:hypothetical protein